MSFLRKKKKRSWSDVRSERKESDSNSMWSSEKIKELLKKAGLC